MSKEVPFERMKKSDGSANPKYVDINTCVHTCQFKTIGDALSYT